MVLCGLVVFQGFVYGMKSMGYDEARLSSLENLHYWASYATIAVLSFDFLGKLVMSIFRND